MMKERATAKDVVVRWHPIAYKVIRPCLAISGSVNFL